MVKPRMLQHRHLLAVKPRLLVATSALSEEATMSARVLVLVLMEECQLATHPSLRFQRSLFRRKGAYRALACYCRTHTFEEIQAVWQPWCSRPQQREE